MNEETYVKEIARVKKLKRAVEAEVELLRSHMEKGVFHFRVNSDRAFRRDLALAICLLDADVNYPQEGYADPVEGKLYWVEQNSFRPWADSVSFRIIPVRDFFPEDTDFSDGDIDFAVTQIKDEIMVG